VRLTDEQWSVVQPHLSRAARRRSGGRQRVCDRDALDGVLWVMATGMPWSAVPDTYPSARVCRSRHVAWTESGVLREIMVALAEDLEYRSGRTVEELVNQVPDSAHERASWWWQTVVLLTSPEVVALVRSDGVSR